MDDSVKEKLNSDVSFDIGTNEAPVNLTQEMRKVRKQKVAKMDKDNEEADKEVTETRGKRRRNVKDKIDDNVDESKINLKIQDLKKFKNKDKHLVPYLCEVVEENKRAESDSETIAIDEKPFRCTECPKTFARQSSLKLHLRTHSGERPYQCTECLKKFSQVSNLKKHEMTHFGIKPFQCTQCLKNFANRQNLKVHERIHSDNKPYKCNECYKAFSQLSNLKHHMLSHSGERPFQCEECSKQFTQISNLKQHLLTHSGTKPFDCKICFKKFSRITHLKQHMLIHTGERPFQCSICLRKFSQHSILKRHIQTHTGEKTHGCKECGKRFTRGFALNKHLATTHFIGTFQKPSKIIKSNFSPPEKITSPTKEFHEKFLQHLTNSIETNTQNDQFSETLCAKNDQLSQFQEKFLHNKIPHASTDNYLS